MLHAFEEACRLVALRLAQARETGEFQAVVFSNTSPSGDTTTLVTQVARHLRTSFNVKPLIARLGPASRPARWWRRAARKRPVPKDRQHGNGGPGTTVLVLPEEEAGDRAPSVGHFVRRASQLVPERFDFLLVDCPSLLESGDALQAAAIIPRLVLVVEAGRTQTETLDQIKSQLATFHVSLIGTVLQEHRNPMPRWMDRWLSR